MPLYQLKRDTIDKTFLFIHIPKTGGTAIEKYFKAVGLSSFYDPASYRVIRPFLKIPPAHYDYEICERLFRLEAIYSFAIVRNPLHRMISEYRWAVSNSTLPDSIKKYTFSEFVDFALGKYQQDENFLAGHLKPQRMFVGKNLTKIFKYEQGLNAIVASVFADTGLKPGGAIEIPLVNKSVRLPVKIKDPDVVAIRNMYAGDFELFGYSSDLSDLESYQ